MAAQTIPVTSRNLYHGFKAASPDAEPASRMGMHYFSDPLHYRESDLQTWLPELKKLGVSWLVLEAGTTSAIPEAFLNGLLASQITPVLRFSFAPDALLPAPDLQMLLNVYAKWGVQYVSFFDRPNERSSWTPAAWAQQDLVERFLDRFIPAAELALANDLTPLFPALEPGGSYWDTAFLFSALQSIVRRKHEKLAHAMALAGYGWTFNRPLDWGAGGPARWPGTRPYHTPEGSQDQRGLHIADWYQAITQAVLGEQRPFFLFEAGLTQPSKPIRKHNELDPESSLKIARLLANEKVYLDDENPDNLPALHPAVICAAFWKLCTSPEFPEASSAWFTPDGKASPTAELVQTWHTRAKVSQLGPNRIRHYLLLPTYEWGIDENHLQVIRPFLRKYRPAVGFSTDEAMLADSVTVIGDETVYNEETLDRLRQAGCRVERIQGDGTTIATLLSER